MDREPIRLEFFFDPICPWAFITSRTVLEAAKLRPIEVTWRFISLIVVNEDKYGWSEATDEAHRRLHERGNRLLRVSAYARSKGGNEAVGRMYTELGSALHVDHIQDDDEVLKRADGVFRELGLSDGPSAQEIAADPQFDDWIRNETLEALERAGKDLGTPIISFDPPEGPSFFGPVLSQILKGEQAAAFFDHLYALVYTPGFSELKRTKRPPRQIEL